MAKQEVTRASMARSSVWHGFLWLVSVGLYGKRTGAYERAKQKRDEKRALRTGGGPEKQDAPVELRRV